MSDSWAQAVDQQELAAESLGNLQLSDEQPKPAESSAQPVLRAPEPPEEKEEDLPKLERNPDINGADKNEENTEKTEDEKEDRAAQSLLNKLIRSNLVNNTNQVEVLQRDPNSPLYSVKSFEELRL